MGGCRCSYKNCTNTTKTRENLHFFHYPVKQKERCRQWIQNANKPQFYDLDEDQLRNKVVCETHFEDRFFPNIQKKRLLQGAIPTLDGDCEKEQITLTIHAPLLTPGLPPPTPPPPPSSSSSSSSSPSSPQSLPAPVSLALSSSSSSSSCDVKIQEVQVLPANADGTIFIVETNNSQAQHQSEQIESYIYTNSGLIKIIRRNIENNGNSNNNNSNNYELVKDNQIDTNLQEVQTINNFNGNVNNVDCVFNQDDEIKQVNNNANVGKDRINKNQETIGRNEIKQQKQKSDISKEIGNKYLKTIKQHSKDIAYIKKILKLRKRHKPSRISIISVLQKCLPSTLLDLITLHLIPDTKLEYNEFFNDIYTKSPELYKLLREKYQWRLPSPTNGSRMIK